MSIYISPVVLFTHSDYSYTESIAILTQYYSNERAKRAIENVRDYSYRIVILTFFSASILTAPLFSHFVYNYSSRILF